MHQSVSLYQRGNVLFLILIAVALFAALSYAVTSSTRSGGDIKNERISSEAARLIQWSADAQAMVLRMRLTDGIAEDGFGFISEESGGPLGTGGNCGTTEKCQFFSNYSAGKRLGGMVFPKILKANFTTEISNFDSLSSYNRQGDVKTVRVKGLGLDTNAELVYQIRGLRKDFCNEINKQLKIDNENPEFGVTYASYGSGAFAEPAGTDMIGDTEPSLIGKSMFCYHTNNYFGGTPYILIIVLIPR